MNENQRDRILANVYGLAAKEIPLRGTADAEWLPRVVVVSVLRETLMTNLRGYWTVR